MLKKFTILSTLATLCVSTLGGVVPTFADTQEVYNIPELVSLHSEYAKDMAVCGAYADTAAYNDCYNNVTSAYRERYGGLFESMYQLDFNGRMIVTGLNPSAGVVRFYMDETKAYKSEAFNFESLVIFWTDSTAIENPTWNEDAGWRFVDSYLAGGEVPKGYHILYSSKRGEEGWIIPNTEMRVFYSEDSSAETFVYNRTYGFVHAYGYDTLGRRHIENNYLESCINSNLLEGGECRLQYTYDGVNANLNYVNADATREDAYIIELKQALKEKAEAEIRLAEAENRLMEAENRLAETESWLIETENMLMEAENRVAEAEARAIEAENRVIEAENRVIEAENRVIEAESRAAEAEFRAENAEAAARAIEESAKIELAAAREALAEARDVIEEARISKESAMKDAEEALKAAEEARKAVDAAKLEAKEATARAELLASNPPTTTTYKIVEKLVKDSSSGPQAAQNTTLEINEPTQPENYIESPISGNEEERVFPWWIVVFVFSGIALILWWFTPSRRKSE